MTQNRILTLYDNLLNGKSGKPKNLFPDGFAGDRGLLDFENNTMVRIFNIVIINDEELKNRKTKKYVKLNKFNIVIFDYAEDKRWANEYLVIANKINNIIYTHYPHITVFNNPKNHNIIVDSFVTYKTFEKSNLILIPSHNLKPKFLNNEFNYPIIVSKRIQSGGYDKHLIHNINEFYKLNLIPNKKGTYDGIFFCKFYESKIPISDKTFSIRLLVFNNKLVDYIIRFSDKNWNVTTESIDWDNIEEINKIDEWFSEYFTINKDYVDLFLDEIYKKIGNGLYCYDLLYIDGKFMITELSYKCIAPKFIQCCKDNNVLLNKLSNNPLKLKEYYANLFYQYPAKPTIKSLNNKFALLKEEFEKEEFDKNKIIKVKKVRKK